MARRHLLVGSLLVVLAAACGSSAPESVSRSATTSSSVNAVTSRPGRAGTSASTQSGSAPTTTGRSAPTASPAGSSQPSTSSAGGNSATQDSPPPPGAYSYRQSGSATFGTQAQPVPSQSTVRIDAAVAEGPGTWAQTWHTYSDPKQPPSDVTYRIGSADIAIVSTVTRASFNGQTLSFTCTFSPPLEVTAWPPKVGYVISGQGSCGSFTATVSGRITGTRHTVVDGQTVNTYVIDATITTRGSVQLTDHEIDWLSPALHLLVHTSDEEHGTYGPVSFSSNVSRDLESPRPK